MRAGAVVDEEVHHLVVVVEALAAVLHDLTGVRANLERDRLGRARLGAFADDDPVAALCAPLLIRLAASGEKNHEADERSRTHLHEFLRGGWIYHRRTT